MASISSRRRTRKRHRTPGDCIEKHRSIYWVRPGLRLRKGDRMCFVFLIRACQCGAHQLSRSLHAYRYEVFGRFARTAASRRLSARSVRRRRRRNAASTSSIPLCAVSSRMPAWFRISPAGGGSARCALSINRSIRSGPPSGML